MNIHSLNTFIMTCLTCLCAATALAQTDITRMDGVEGNWNVSISGVADEVGVQDFRINLFQERETICAEGKVGGCFFRQQINSAGEWTLNYTLPDGPLSGVQGLAVNANGSEALIDHSYFVFGRWGGDEKAQATGPDSVNGDIQYKDQQANTQWERIVPNITEVTAMNEPNLDHLGEFTAIGPRHVSLALNWKDLHWSDTQVFPDQRPSFIFRLKGPGLWGRHFATFPSSRGIQTGHVSSLRGPDGSNYLNFWVKFWPGFKDGRHILNVSGIEIIVDVRIIGLPNAPDECNWKDYFQYIRDKGPALISEFEKDTLKLIEQDNNNVIDSKLYPYSRAGFVSFDENAAITKWEKLISEMISNQGADDWLKAMRLRIINGYRSVNREYWQSAFAEEACPGYYDSKPYNQKIAVEPLAGEVVVRARQSLAADLEAARQLRDKYTQIVYRKLSNTGKLSSKLTATAKREISRILTGAGTPPQKLEALTPQLDALREKFTRMKTEGRPPNKDQVNQEVKQAFARAGIRYDPAEVEKAGEDDVVDLGLWSWNFITSIVYPPISTNPVATGSSYAASAIDHINIFKAIFDIGTLNTVQDQEMPVVNAVQEDAAHLEVLIRRYELFYERYDKFAEDYRAMFTAAKKSAGSN